MKYLSVEEISAINQIVVEESGGSIGLRDAGLLESISVRPQTSAYGQDMYPDIFLKSAVLYEALINYHVFVDGNKRTGFAAMARFLYINGYELAITDKEIEDYTVSVAVENPDVAEVAAWIKKHANKI